MKRFIINTVLICGFCLLAVAITRPLLAELSFSAAGKLIKEYKWSQANSEFRKAIALDPFNSKYLAGFGDFLTAQAGYQGYKEPLLKEAELLYRRAIELDGRKAECYLELGTIELGRKEYGKAFKNFHKAVENDPNGFNIAYSIGCAGLGAWKNIGEAERAFVVNRLKIAITARPWSDIYAKAWNARKDMELLKAIAPDNLEGQQRLYDFIISRNLWQFRKAQAKRLMNYIEKETPNSFLAEKTEKAKWLKKLKDRYKLNSENKGVISVEDWRGNCTDEKNEYKNGNMYWSGTMDAAIDTPKGDVVIVIRARGQPAGGEYPYMIVSLDREEVGESLVNSPEWKDYEFKVNTEGGIKVLSITFANDGGNEKEDRNLFVSTAEIRTASNKGK